MYKIGFSNQATGRLFKNLVEDLIKDWFPSVLYMGKTFDEQINQSNGSLIIKSFNSYERKNNLRRLLSGFVYLKNFIYHIIKFDHKILMVVSNPPFIGLGCLLLKYFFKQRYVMLVYDIYPDVLIGINKVSSNSFVVKVWRMYNKKVYENSDAVITIGESMKKNLEQQFDVSKTKIGQIIFIPNCADPQYIKPVSKLNFFTKKYNLVDKLTIIYAGNFGETHSFDIILNVAKKFISNDKITFILIGEGSKKNMIDYKIISEKLNNVISLPFQSDEAFPTILGSADISLITMADGCEKSMVPSKIYYSMAVGSVIFGISGEESEINKIIMNSNCGVNVLPGDEECLYENILNLYDNPKLLNKFKQNSLDAFYKYYTRDKMSSKYNALFQKLFRIS